MSNTRFVWFFGVKTKLSHILVVSPVTVPFPVTGSPLTSDDNVMTTTLRETSQQHVTTVTAPPVSSTPDRTYTGSLVLKASKGINTAFSGLWASGSYTSPTTEDHLNPFLIQDHHYKSSLVEDWEDNDIDVHKARPDFYILYMWLKINKSIKIIRVN